MGVGVTKRYEYEYDAHAWDLKCAYLIESRRFEEAVSASDAALRINPEFKIAYYNRACANALSGNAGAALDDLEQAFPCDPDFFREHAQQDPSFEVLKTHPRFQEILGLRTL